MWKKFSFLTCTCKPRDLATASQFQTAFKLPMQIMQIALSQLVQSWRALCRMLQPISVIFLRTTSGDLKPGGRINTWMKLYMRNVHGSKLYNALKGRHVNWVERGKTAYIDAKHVRIGWGSMDRTARSLPWKCTSEFYPKPTVLHPGAGSTLVWVLHLCAHVILYADDMLLIADTQLRCIAKFKMWKTGRESKELHDEDKFLISGVCLDASAVVSPISPSSARSVSYGSTRGGVASLIDW